MSRRPGWWLNILAWGFPLAQFAVKSMKVRFIGRIARLFLVPFLSGKNFNITYLPINEEVSTSHSLLSETVVQELVRRSAHRVIIHRCTCRDGNTCQKYPVDLGCLLLGEGTIEIDSRVGKHATVDEALKHVNNCIKAGLLPFVGRFRPDNFIWGVRDRGKLLTICFCCRCCCIILNTAKYFPEISVNSLVKLRGLEIITNTVQCDLCALCTEECFVNARKIQNGIIIYDSNRCKGCGRCISVCPQNAIELKIEDTDSAIDELMNRINSIIDIS